MRQALLEGQGERALLEGQGQVLRLRAGAWGFFEGSVGAMERVRGLFAVEDLLDGQNLYARISGFVG